MYQKFLDKVNSDTMLMISGISNVIKKVATNEKSIDTRHLEGLLRIIDATLIKARSSVMAEVGADPNDEVRKKVKALREEVLAVLASRKDYFGLN